MSNNSESTKAKSIRLICCQLWVGRIPQEINFSNKLFFNSRPLKMGQMLNSSYVNLQAGILQPKSCSFFPFQLSHLMVNVPFLYPLETSENQGFSDVFRGYRNGTLTWNELIYILVNIIFSINQTCWLVSLILKVNLPCYLQNEKS